MFELQHDLGMLGRAAAAGLIGPVFPPANQEPAMDPADQSQPWYEPGSGRVPASQRELSSSAEVEMGCPDNPDREMKNGKRHGNKNA